MKNYKTTGNTFMVKSALKDAGFKFDPEKKEWNGDESAMSKFDKITTPSWSGANANARRKSGIGFIEEVR